MIITTLSVISLIILSAWVVATLIRVHRNVQRRLEDDLWGDDAFVGGGVTARRDEGDDF